MSILLSDAKYEKRVYTQLTDIACLMYATIPHNGLAISKEVKAISDNADPAEVRNQMDDLIDYIRTTYKYILYDNECLRREIENASP